MMKKIRTAPLFHLMILLMLLLAGLSQLLPDQEHSALENRPLAQLPRLELGQVMSGRYMDQAESYVNDQLPFRDAFVQLNLLKEMALMKTESHGVVRGRGQRLFNQSKQVDVKDIEYKVDALGRFATAVDMPVTLLMIPPSITVYQEDLPAFYPLKDPVPLIEAMAGNREGLKVVPLQEALALEKQQQMTHYRTDHHVTAAGAKVVYQALAASLGFTPQPAAAQVRVLDGFLGSLYARAPYPFMQADALSYYEVDGVSLEIDGETMPGLVDPALLDRPNMYAALLYNNPGYLVLHNPAASRGPALVLRDSNANAVLPLLAQDYRELHVVDFRYLKLGFHLTDLVLDHGIKEVLCIYGTDVFLSDRNLLLHLASSRN